MFALMAVICSIPLASALPWPIRDVGAPSTAQVVWYQATAMTTDTTCGYKVSEGSLEAEKCYTLRTAALGIQQHEKASCVFKVWEGVSDCSGLGSWTETIIPAGNATTCIYANVLDGGAFQHKSGRYRCSSEE